MNNSLLLDTGVVYNNNIYLCFAKDVFEYCEKNDISSEQTSKIYFPFLYKLDINNLDDLQSENQSLIGETNKLIKSSLSNFENINMFYNVYKYKENSDVFSLNYKKTGIKNIKIVMHPEYKVKIPIDVIFKLIHFDFLSFLCTNIVYMRIELVRMVVKYLTYQKQLYLN